MNNKVTTNFNECLKYLKAKLVSNDYKVYVSKKDESLQHVDLLVCDIHNYAVAFMECALHLHDENMWCVYKGYALGLPHRFIQVYNIIEEK